MATSALDTVAAGGVQLACVEARGHVYGLDVRHVREIVRALPATPLPKAPRLVEGLVELRGALLPLVDLGRALDGASGDVGAGTRIAVVEIDGLVLGLRVDAALEVLAVEAEAVEAPPSLGVRSRGALRGVVRRPGEAPVLVLCLEELLAGLRDEPRPGAPGSVDVDPARVEEGSR